jgi:hypothetical protein
MTNRALLSYLPLMFRDYLLTRGGAMLVVSIVFVGPILIAFGSTNVEMTPEQMSGQAIGVIQAVSTFLTLIATYGLIGQDFRLGYYRSLFAKPLSSPLYYAAVFGCALAGFWLVQGFILATFGVFGVNAWDPGVALDITMSFLILGSMVFAFSRVSRLDWIFAVFFMALAGPLRNAYPAEEFFRGKIINVLFPPMHLFELTPAARGAGQTTSLVSDAGPEWVSLAWISGYSLVFFAIAIVLVRRLPLASAQ